MILSTGSGLAAWPVDSASWRRVWAWDRVTMFQMGIVSSTFPHPATLASASDSAMLSVAGPARPRLAPRRAFAWSRASLRYPQR